MKRDNTLLHIKVVYTVSQPDIRGCSEKFSA